MSRDDGTGTRVFGISLGAAVGLVGLLVSLAIVALIWRSQLQSMGRGGKQLGIPGGGPMRIIDSTRVTATIVKMREIGAALEEFRSENGGYPGDAAYVLGKRNLPSDRWGARFEYAPIDRQARPGRRETFRDYELVSRGADGLRGTADDIVMRHGVVEAGLEEADAGGDEEAAPEAGTEEGDEEASAGEDEPEPTPRRAKREAAPSPGIRALDAARGVGSRPSTEQGSEEE